MTRAVGALATLCVLTGVASAEEDELAVHVPEPMVFDLVRGLGAHRGELEINTLSRLPLNDVRARGIEWAPEVEVAVADGVGIELELPIHDGTLEAYKLAGQGTFSGLFRRHFLHGVQVIAEKARGKEGVELSTLYIPVVRFNRMWSAMAMVGVRTEVGAKEPTPETFLLNTTLFMEPNRATAFGLELNLSAPRGERATLLVMPQIEREIDHHWTIQAGFGAQLGEAGPQWTAAFRLVWATAFVQQQVANAKLARKRSRAELHAQR